MQLEPRRKRLLLQQQQLAGTTTTTTTWYDNDGTEGNKTNPKAIQLPYLVDYKIDGRILRSNRTKMSRFKDGRTDDLSQTCLPLFTRHHGIRIIFV
jgi:hypothetical protein